MLGASSASEDACEECPEGANCPPGTMLRTLELQRGYWRLSRDTLDIRSCPSTTTDDGDVWSPCRGGVDVGTDGDGYCEAEGGFLGPRCEVCEVVGGARAPAACARTRV